MNKYDKEVGKNGLYTLKTNKQVQRFFFSIFRFFFKVPIVKAIQIDPQTHLLHLHIGQKEGL